MTRENLAIVVLESIALLASITLNAILMFVLASRTRDPVRRYATACRHCGYDTRATIGGRCSECGEPAILRPAHLDPTVITRCDFCGRSHVETGPQVEGVAGVFICAPCVELCHDTIRKNREAANAPSR